MTLSSSNSNRNKKGQRFWLLGDTYTFCIEGAETDGKYAVLEISSPPGSKPPLHSHTKETEASTLLMENFHFNMDMTTQWQSQEHSCISK
jgi:hypothetical protein